MKLYRDLIKYIKENIGFIVFTVCILIEEILLRKFSGLSISKAALVLNVLFVIFLYTVLALLKHEYKNIALLILIIIDGFYCFAQTLHFDFFKTFFSFKKASVISELFNVINEVVGRLKVEHLLFIIPVIIFITYLIISKNHNKQDQSSIFTRVLVLFMSFVLLVGGRYMYKQHLGEVTDDVTSDAYLYENMTSNLLFIDRFGVFEFICKDIENIVRYTYVSLNNEEIEEIRLFIEENKHDKSINQGIYDGKNLIMVLCESLAPQAIDETLTPTLYMLKNEGYYFSNFYSPVYPSSTCDSEFISLTGMIPSIDYGTTSKTFAQNYYPYSLPNLFKDKGYEVNSFHSFDKSFYNREQLHYSLGFTYLYDRNDLGIYVDENDVDYINWIDDKELFEKMLEKTDLDKPFFNYVISVSGHLPYFVERDELWENYETVINTYPDLNEQEAFYYASQMKLDEGLKYLLDCLNEKGSLEDTVIVLFGDHYPYGIDNEDAINNLYGILENEYEMYKTPMIIYDAGKTGENKDNLSSTFDLYPTVSSLFNLNDDNVLEVGYDVFGDNGNEMVLFADHSVLGNGFYYNANTSGIMGVDANNLIELSKKYYSISQKMLAGDFYKNKIN